MLLPLLVLPCADALPGRSAAAAVMADPLTAKVSSSAHACPPGQCRSVSIDDCCGIKSPFTGVTVLLIRGATLIFWEIGTGRDALPRGNFLMPVRKLVAKARECDLAENEMQGWIRRVCGGLNRPYRRLCDRLACSGPPLVILAAPPPLCCATSPPPAREVRWCCPGGSGPAGHLRA